MLRKMFNALYFFNLTFEQTTFDIANAIKLIIKQKIMRTFYLYYQNTKIRVKMYGDGTKLYFK